MPRKNASILFDLWELPLPTGLTSFAAKNIDLLDPDTFRSFSARPERIKEIIDGQAGRSCAIPGARDTTTIRSVGLETVIIDKIQKLPELLDLVHLFIESGSRLQFVLTGSSARKLKRTGVDLLAGRALFKAMHPFNFNVRDSDIINCSKIAQDFRLYSRSGNGRIAALCNCSRDEEDGRQDKQDWNDLFWPRPIALMHQRPGGHDKAGAQACHKNYFNRYYRFAGAWR